MSMIERFLGGVREDCEIAEKNILFNRYRHAKLLEANLPHAVSGDILSAEQKTPEYAPKAQAAIESADKYLEHFCKPGPCPCCGRKYGFYWGIVHGEGQCKCNYPGRAHHDIEGVGRILNMVLWYHPNELSFGKQNAE